jgi:two-component system NarL family sensor kinase
MLIQKTRPELEEMQLLFQMEVGDRNLAILKYVTTMLLLLMPYLAQANRSTIDSLLERSNLEKVDSVQAFLYNELSLKYVSVNIDSALLFADRAIALSGKIQNKRILAQGYAKKALALKYGGNWGDALGWMYKALKIREQNNWNIDIGRSHLDIGNVYREEALIDYEYKEKFREAAKIYKTAFNHYQQALMYFQESGDKFWIGEGYNAIGYGCYDLYKYKEALLNYGKSKEIFLSINRNDKYMGILVNEGIIYEQRKQYEKAAQIYRTALTFMKNSGDIKNWIVCLINIAEVYKKQLLVEKAISELHKAEKLAKKQGDLNQLARIRENLFQTYLLNQQHDKALDYHLIYVRLKDSIHSLASKTKIAQIRASYQSEKKEQQNQLLSAQNNNLNQKNQLGQKQNQLLTIGLIAVVLGLLLSFIYLLYYRQRQLSYRLRHQQEINDLMRKQDSQLINAMLDGQEQERKRIALDLHDRMGSLLATLKIYYNNLSSRFDKLDQQQENEYKKTGDLLNKAVEELRNISKNLVSGVLLTFGFTPAIRELTQSINDTTAITVKLNVFGMDERLSSNIEVSLFRVIQELLTNTLKHAWATEVTIRVHRKEEILQLNISDNGKGFDWEIAKAQSGIGLKSILTRIKGLNGELIVETASGKGASFQITIPLKIEKQHD